MSVYADNQTIAQISAEIHDLTVEECYLVYSYIKSLKASREKEGK